MQKKQVKITNLSKSFGNQNVLHNVNLTINSGESVAIVGASGCGKSVLLKCIAGLMIPDSSSSITINGIECGNRDISHRHIDIKRIIGMLFQGNALFDGMKVSENITFGNYMQKACCGFISKQDKVVLQTIAKQQLEMVDLPSSSINKYPHELSGGMQKRVAMARVMSTNPEIMLLDEPTTGLDPVTTGNISKLISEIHQKFGATIITITHDPICAKIIADRIVLIDNGTISWDGIITDIANASSPYMDAFRSTLQI